MPKTSIQIYFSKKYNKWTLDLFQYSSNEKNIASILISEEHAKSIIDNLKLKKAAEVENYWIQNEE